MPPFKDEHILIIVPGSQTTLAQLGLPESFTTPSHRFPTRMFLAPDRKTWEPHKICERPKEPSDGNVAMSGTSEERETEFVEYPDQHEGAIWPIKEGRIENLPAFLALLQHIHNTFSPTLHTPILLVSQPSWTAKNHEDITQFIFEKFKTPGLCIIDSAIATSYAYGVANATIIDVGFEKTDITAILDFVISARGVVKDSGGEGMTRQLMELLKSKDFTRDMAEQLKRSPICEILPPGIPLPTPGTTETTIVNEVLNSKSTDVVSSGMAFSSADIKIPDMIPEKIEDKFIEDEGVLDIAAIVTSGKTQDFLAKKEKEKVERTAARKATKDAEKAEATLNANKPIKLPNSRKPRAIFHYEEYVKNVTNLVETSDPQTAISITSDTANSDEALNIAVSGDSIVLEEDGAAKIDQLKDVRKEEKKKISQEKLHLVRRDIEVGIERFQGADNGYMDAIADTVYRTILSIDDISKRQDAWESLIICGSGSKVRGFKEALLGVLNNRYLVTPSSAPTFISEPPSNLDTPRTTPIVNVAMIPNTSFSSSITPTQITGVGNQNFPTTPMNPMMGHISNQPNTNMNSNLTGIPATTVAATTVGQNQQSRSQTPTSIKLVNPPTYFPEWKHFDEAIFLGSQVAAKVFFVNDQGQSKAFLSRMEFNEDGPTAIHQV
ncbi:putative chromatin remodeling complex subunit [Erysiphe neolycopersici]|uniref:Putative chromatin remodeling complex subunit n=1 Tax=Erysiphe neolycopersici TaxID=212602 RepID=A0A420HPH7_9PEZI|nr:putative chromatin remodeling complex subunit [Erysiphe neolycopersici]